MNAFNIFRLSKTISEIGTALRNIVWPLLAFTITNDAKIMIIIFALDQCCTTIATLFAPYIADRFNRKYVLIIDDLISALCLTPFIFLTKDNLWIIYPLTIIWSVSNGLVTNLQELIIDGIKTQDSIRTKLAKFSTPLQFVSIVVCIAGSFLITYIGAKTVFLIDSISFVICALLLTQLPYEHRSKKEIEFNSAHTIKNYFRDGLAYTLNNRKEFKLILLMTMFIFFFQGLTFATHLPFIKATLNSPDFFVGIWKMIVPLAILLVNFGITKNKFIGDFSNEIYMALGIIGFSLAYFLMSASYNVYMFLILFFISCASLQFYRIAIFSLALEQSDENLKSRVTGNIKFAASIGYTLGQFSAILIYPLEKTGRLNYLMAGFVDLICVLVFVRLILPEKKSNIISEITP